MEKEIRRLTTVLLGIPVAVLALILIYPLLYSLYISFFDYNLLSGVKPVFVGLKNYTDLLGNSDFWQSLWITNVFVVVSVVLQMVLGFLLALLMYRNFRGSNILRPAFLLPYVIPPSIVGIMWKWLLNADYGILRWFCDLLNIPAFSVLGDSNLAIYGIVLADVWHMTPIVFLLLIGGLQAIPNTVYEAADVDGASGIRRLFYITIPMMRKIITVTLVYRILTAVRTFDKVLAMTQGGPGTSTQILSWFIYSEGFKAYDFGSASAMSYVMLVVVLVFCTIYLKVQSRDD